MAQNILTKLNFKLNIADLREYYTILSTQFQHLNWNWEKCNGQLVNQWKIEVSRDPANLLTHGWAIQSNLVDLTAPCPPWDISSLPTTNYRNTELAFGIITRLQEKIPYGYRWAVSVQPPGGKVSLHSDQKNEYTVWIPIFSNQSNSITFLVNKTETNLKLDADGSAYLLDTTFPHYTSNQGNETRVTIIFRLNQKYKKKLLDISSI